MPQMRFPGRNALVLLRPGHNMHALTGQLVRLGLSVTLKDVDKCPKFEGVNFCFFEVDAGFEGMFPWKAGEAPVPLIALVGNETRGRLEWMLRQEPCSFLPKPVQSVGVLSALVLADREFVRRLRMKREIANSYKRHRARRIVTDALLKVMATFSVDEPTAYHMLRRASQKYGLSIEDVSAAISVGSSQNVDIRLHAVAHASPGP